MDFQLEEAARILRALEFGVEAAGPDSLRVTTPPHRLDIQEGAADLIDARSGRVRGVPIGPVHAAAEQQDRPKQNRFGEASHRPGLRAWSPLSPVIGAEVR